MIPAMNRSDDDMDRKERTATCPAPGLRNFCSPPHTVKGFAGGSGDPALEHLDGIVDEMVSGSAPFRDLWLVGPLGSGKRTLARAIAHEFGGRVTEVEPTQFHDDAGMRALLLGLRASDVLVAHNIDEFHPRPRRQLLAATANRVVIGSGEEGPAYVDPSRHCIMPSAPAVPQPIAEFMMITTTNVEGGMPPGVMHRALVFNLRRSVAGAAAAMRRALRGHGIACSEECSLEFGRMLEAAWGDPFAASVALVVGQARRRGFTEVDEALAAELVAGCWRLLPQAGIARTIARARARWGCTAPAAADRLRIPAELMPEPGQAGPACDERCPQDEDDADG